MMCLHLEHGFIVRTGMVNILQLLEKTLMNR